MLATDMAAVARILEGRPLGARMWIRGVGRSMAPIIRSGDALQIVRCEPSELSVGDIAALGGPNGTLVVHLVVSTRPVRTSTFLGRPDPPDLRPLGRVVALRRGRWTFPTPAIVRPALLWAHRLASRAARNAALRRALDWGRNLLASRATLAIRTAWVGTVEVRKLVPNDLEAALLFTGDNVPGAAVAVAQLLPARWQERGGAFGALRRDGSLVGFTFLDEYRREGVDLDGYWIRFLHVAPIARGMGLAGALVREACAEAKRQGIRRVHADVLADNAASLAVFTREGFVRDDALTALVQQRLGSDARKLVALTWSNLE